MKPAQSTRQRWLTVSDVVEETQYHVETVREMLRTGKLRGSKIGRTWRIRPEDLDKLFRDRANRFVNSRSDRS